MKLVGEFIVMYPLYVIMFGDRGGVDAAGIGIIVATGLILSVIFEIPTGVIGDKLPKKRVLTAAIMCRICTFVIWLVAPYFWGYMLAASLFALGAALESGALQAYLYGTLGVDSKNSFGKFWARVSALVMLSYTVAYILASLIGINYPVLISLSIAASSISLLLCLTLPLDAVSPEVQVEKPRIFASAVSHIMKTPELIKLLVGAVTVVALAEVVIEYGPLYFQQVGMSVRSVPLIRAIDAVIGATFFWTLHSWEKYLNSRKALIMIVVMLLFIGTFRGGALVATVGFIIFTRLVRVFQVQFESSIQHLSSEKARVTISSIGAFSAKITASIMILSVGALAVDNVILKPLRLSLIIVSSVFVLLLAIGSYRNKVKLVNH